MVGKRTYITYDKVKVTMSSLHVLDLWTEYIELNPQYIDAAYQDVLSDIQRKVRYYFTEDQPILQIPFKIKTKNTPEHYPQWLVAFAVVGDGARLVVTKMFKSIEGVLFEKELSEILNKVDWCVHAEEKLEYETYDHFGDG